MRRFTSHHICVGANDFRQRTVVECDENWTVTALFTVDDEQCEPANTIFVDGIISGELTSTPNTIPPTNSIRPFISQHTRPILLGERNRLIVWQGLDYTNKCMGNKATMHPL